MDEPVPHPSGGTPRNAGHGVAGSRAEILGRLTDDLDELGQAQAQAQ
jgi:hypothetical protein